MEKTTQEDQKQSRRRTINLYTNNVYQPTNKQSTNNWEQREQSENTHFVKEYILKKRIKPKLGSCVGNRWKRPRRGTRNNPEQGP